MPTYHVTTTLHTSVSATVEAETHEEAMEKARAIVDSAPPFKLTSSANLYTQSSQIKKD